MGRAISIAASGGIMYRSVVADMLESRDGTMWLSSTAGLLKLDREHKRIVRYHNRSSDYESHNAVFQQWTLHLLPA
jgi:hypothetical protein